MTAASSLHNFAHLEHCFTKRYICRLARRCDDLAFDERDAETPQKCAADRPLARSPITFAEESDSVLGVRLKLLSVLAE
jgi:hypothetical protein